MNSPSQIRLLPKTNRILIQESVLEPLPAEPASFRADAFDIFWDRKTGLIQHLSDAAAELTGLDVDKLQSEPIDKLFLWQVPRGVKGSNFSSQTQLHSYNCMKMRGGNHLDVELVTVWGQSFGSLRTTVILDEKSAIPEPILRLSPRESRVSSGSFSIKAGGVIQNWDSASAAIFGYSEKEVIGKSIEILKPVINQKALTPAVFAAAGGAGNEKGIEIMATAADGTPLHLSFFPFHESSGGDETSFALQWIDLTFNDRREEVHEFTGSLCRALPHASGMASAAEILRRISELMIGEHAMLFALEGKMLSDTSPSETICTVELVHEWMVESHPGHSFRLPIPGLTLKDPHLKWPLCHERAVRFLYTPVGGESHDVPVPHLAISLRAANDRCYVLLLERSAVAPAWNDGDALLLEDLSETLTLLLESHVARMAAQERGNQLRNILDTTDNAVMFVDFQRQHPVLSFVNHRFCEFFRVLATDLEDVFAHDAIDLIRPALKDPDVQVPLFHQLCSDPVAHVEDELMLATGPVAVLKRISLPARDKDGLVCGRLFFFRDITLDKDMEHQLLHSQKMESIGTLAGGVAHDFNNLLTTMLGNTELLKRQFQEQPEIFAKLRQIEKSGQRAAELTRNLLAFSRRNPTVLRVINLNHLMEETLAILRSSIPANIEIQLELDPDLPYVEADETQLQQVLINLALNARDAISKNGNITISTRRSIDPQSNGDDDPTVYAVLDVSDNGHGIPEDVLHRVFEPFYTTKEVGKGTGLGLAMVYGIIKKHGGFIEVKSAPKVGSKFSVYIPVTHMDPSDSDSKAQASQPSGPPAKGRKSTMLIVDDEADLREFCYLALEDRCEHIFTAGNGVEALEVVEKHNLPFDLVILDLTMPKMSGTECFQRLRRLDPKMKILISSGYSLNQDGENLLSEGATGFLPKPYTLVELTKAVDKALRWKPGDKCVG